MEDVSRPDQQLYYLLGFSRFCGVLSPNERRVTSDRAEEFIHRRGGVVGLLEDGPKLGRNRRKIKVLEQKNCRAACETLRSCIDESCMGDDARSERARPRRPRDANDAVRTHVKDV